MAATNNVETVNNAVIVSIADKLSEKAVETGAQER
jgi:hypothetical protein